MRSVHGDLLLCQLLQSLAWHSRLLLLGTLAVPGADGPSRQGGPGTWQRELPEAIATKGMGLLMTLSPARKGGNGQEKQMTSFISMLDLSPFVNGHRRGS